MQIIWRNIMISLSKRIFVAAIMFGKIASGFAGEAILFDDPGLIGYRDGESISGLYDAENEKFSCYFLFSQDGGARPRPNIGGYTDTALLTFIPGDRSLEYNDRNRFFDIPGNLYRENDEWVLHTSSGQAGCENSTGGFTFKLGSKEASRYSVEETIPAIGIRLIKRKSFLYNYQNGKFLARRGFLTKGNAVIVLEKRDGFSLVRFSDPRLNKDSYGKITINWIHTVDLVDPFPSIIRALKQ